MSRADRLARILGQMPPEPDPPKDEAKPVRREAEVLHLPVRSKWLDNTAKSFLPAGGVEVSAGVMRLVSWAPYAAGGILALTIGTAGLVGYTAWHKTATYASIGKQACAIGPVLVPEYECAGGALHCTTDEMERVVKVLRRRANEQNLALMDCDKATRPF